MELNILNPFQHLIEEFGTRKFGTFETTPNAPLLYAFLKLTARGRVSQGSEARWSLGAAGLRPLQSDAGPPPQGGDGRGASGAGWSVQSTGAFLLCLGAGPRLP